MGKWERKPDATAELSTWRFVMSGSSFPRTVAPMPSGLYADESRPIEMIGRKDLLARQSLPDRSAVAPLVGDFLKKSRNLLDHCTRQPLCFFYLSSEPGSRKSPRRIRVGMDVRWHFGTAVSFRLRRGEKTAFLRRMSVERKRGACTNRARCRAAA